MKYRFIASEAELKNICDDFLKEKMIGVDLEADSMHCFKEKICLIQIATQTQAFLIDPFEVTDVSSFVEILENPDIKKVFHGADFDIRSLDRDYTARVNNLFDTEIACRFLGIQERGLAALLKCHFDVDVDKKFQKKDWSKRPLDPEMVDYSVSDVAYLIDLHDIISDQLIEKNRFDWAKEEFELQEQVRYENNYTLPLFKKFKGAGRMDNRSLAVLENLLQLRYDLAEQKDRPLFKVLSNPALMTMAYKKPVTIDQMLKEKALTPKQADMFGDKCVAAVAEAMQLEHNQLPSYPKMRRPKKDEQVQKRINQLKKMREKLSHSLEMDPGFLLNNAMISTIARQNPATLEALGTLDQIKRWQVQAFGDDILETIGKKTINKSAV